MLISKNNLIPEKQAECLQNNWVALDPKTGASLRCSLEVQPVDQIEYFLYIPNVMVRVIWARTDEEAMAIANNGWIGLFNALMFGVGMTSPGRV
jgi:hypothetical protein